MKVCILLAYIIQKMNFCKISQIRESFKKTINHVAMSDSVSIRNSKHCITVRKAKCLEMKSPKEGLLKDIRRRWQSMNFVDVLSCFLKNLNRA